MARCGAVLWGGPFLLAGDLHLGAMSLSLTLRAALPSDLAKVDMLLARSYPRLLRKDYPPSVMVLALPIIVRARPELLSSGRYYLAFGADGKLLGAGGWSRGAPAPSGQPDTQLRNGGVGHVGHVGHVRHVATDPAAVRQGVGRAVMAAVFDATRRAGLSRLECLSTRTAVPFYSSLGFKALGVVEVPLRAGIVFPAVQMVCDFT